MWLLVTVTSSSKILDEQLMMHIARGRKYLVLSPHFASSVGFLYIRLFWGSGVAYNMTRHQAGKMGSRTTSISNDIHLLWHVWFGYMAYSLKAYWLRQKGGSYMLVLLASPRWRWCPGEYSLVSLQHDDSLVSCESRSVMKPANIRPETSGIWEKLIKPT